MKNKEINEDEKCAPGIVYETGSCIELAVLTEMVNAYNKDSKDPIKIDKTLETLNPTKYKKYLLEEINKKLENKCTDQICWTTQSFIKHMNTVMRNKLENFTFRPTGPDGRFEWLNTININEVMNQYEKKYPEFKFLGAVPMDFDDLPSLGIKNLDLSKLTMNGKSKLGIIFNLDEHWKSGSHWVAMFADLKKRSVYYFDSYGIAPEPRVRKLMRRLIKFTQGGNGSKPIADHNKIRHQYGNSECGVYSINFIERMLDGESFEHICESKTPDKVVNMKRVEYFRNVNF